MAASAHATAQPAAGPDVPEALALADWRIQVSGLYARVRESARPAAAWALWRAQRERLFRTHPQSPLPAVAARGAATLPCFAYDAGWRFEVPVNPCAPREPIVLALADDGPLTLHPALTTVGLAPVLGRELTIYALGGYGGGLFLPFADATGGAETYGGGRYLLDTIKGAHLGGAQGRLVLDFNFAYNPSCAYDARWSCPLAPPENRLPVPVRAGELRPL